MKKKLAAALSGGAALVLALSGCSDDSGKKTDDWAKKVCDDMRPQVKKIEDANASLAKVNQQQKSPEDIKKADAAAFQKVSDAYKSLATALKEAGAPPVDDGEKVQQGAVDEFTSLSKGYADLKKQTEKLKTGDTFDKELEGVATKIGTLGKGGAQAIDKLVSGDVGKAMANQKGCQKPSGSPTAGS